MYYILLCVNYLVAKALSDALLIRHVECKWLNNSKLHKSSSKRRIFITAYSSVIYTPRPGGSIGYEKGISYFCRAKSQE